MNKQCPNCGSLMRLDGSTNKWVCTNFVCNYEESNSVVENNNNDINSDKIINNDFDDNISSTNIVENTSDNTNNDNTNDLLNMYGLYYCRNCNYSFYGNNKNNCFFCGSSLERQSSDFKYDKYIDFNLSKEDAVNKYKKSILNKIFIPINFRLKKNYMRMTGVYIPMDMFDVTLDGDVIFNASDLDVISSSKGNKKFHYFMTTCNGHFDYNNVLINKSLKFKNTFIEHIQPFDTTSLSDFNNFNLGNNIIYKEDCEDSGIYDRLKNRCTNTSLKMMKDLVNHSKSNISENKLEFNYNKKCSVLIPVYILYNVYKGKEYKFIMNGQNGKIYIETPMDTVLIIVFSILLFIILFLLGLLFCIIF